MNVEIQHIEKGPLPPLEDLYRAYIREMARYLEPDSETKDTDRLLRGLSRYWDDDDHWAYLIDASGENVGFCLVRKHPAESGTYDIEQFFIADAFKRQKVGSKALRQILKLHPGEWLVRVLKSNQRALRFWQQSIRACIGTSYSIGYEQDDGLEMHFIRFRAINP